MAKVTCKHKKLREQEIDSKLGLRKFTPHLPNGIGVIQQKKIVGIPFPEGRDGKK